MSKNTMTIDTVALDTKMTEIAKVLTKHGVFGSRNDKEDNDYEEASFVRMVNKDVTEDSFWSYLELTYRASDVRLIIKTTVDETSETEGVARLVSIDAYDHPSVNPKMDYAGLNADIKAV